MICRRPAVGQRMTGSHKTLQQYLQIADDLASSETLILQLFSLWSSITVSHAACTDSPSMSGCWSRSPNYNQWSPPHDACKSPPHSRARVWSTWGSRVQSQFPNHWARLDSPRSSGLQLWQQQVDPQTSQLESLPHPAQYRQSTQHIQQPLVCSTHAVLKRQIWITLQRSAQRIWIKTWIDIHCNTKATARPPWWRTLALKLSHNRLRQLHCARSLHTRVVSLP